VSSVRLNRAAIEAWAGSDDAKRILDKLGEAIADDAAAAAPRRSGEGAESIHHVVGEDKDGAYVRVSWAKSRFYMFFHEVGTSKMPARPFLRPAAEKRRNL
jgi:HK97 gp10 family phage protein